ncbi:hypothetical protein Q5752_003557 [Cryptotrichosporon argae]
MLGILVHTVGRAHFGDQGSFAIAVEELHRIQKSYRVHGETAKLLERVNRRTKLLLGKTVALSALTAALIGSTYRECSWKARACEQASASSRDNTAAAERSLHTLCLSSKELAQLCTELTTAHAEHTSDGQRTVQSSVLGNMFNEWGVADQCAALTIVLTPDDGQDSAGSK